MNRQYEDSDVFAKSLDEKDALNLFREEFYIPKHAGKDVIYFCGNSLGLQPKTANTHLQSELKSWRENGVGGHFTGDKPWVRYHEFSKRPLAELIGSSTQEVVSMNSLTTNLHLLLASFYQPSGDRVKVIVEEGAFPSDHFAVESHMRMKGIDPAQHLEILGLDSNGYLSPQKIAETISQLGQQLALILLPGVQYYTGQLLNIKLITQLAHEVGALAGFDLAHAIGNVPLALHDDQVDFATWCSYKYLNSGPGNVSGIFIHDRHGKSPNTPKLTGWWGHHDHTRFQMKTTFDPMPGADGWQLSNVNVFGTAIHHASLDIFQRAGIQRLRQKSISLTGFLEFLITENVLLNDRVTIITPSNPTERGCQLSLIIKQQGKAIFEKLVSEGIVVDWREPNVIRVAPTPLYNTFTDVYQFYKTLKMILSK
ncbi:MAG: kynureninase [Cyclobacteriaceae bacterium]|nr:kynureninase [Cyclobacteriaceae bacterium HetDA_MAG_MS6]